MAVSTEDLTLEQMGARSLIYCFAPFADTCNNGPSVMSEAEGIHVRDNAGREYIDALAGIWCVNIGYGREEMAEAIADQVRKMAYFHSFWGSGNEPSIRVADRLRELAPVDNARVFFGNSGSDANDTQIKLVWYYNNLLGRPNKKKIIARGNAYHGATIASSSLSGLPFLKQGFDLFPDRFLLVEKPHHYWNGGDLSEEEYSQKLARELEDLIEKEGPDNIAAFFVEPLQGAGGVIVPPRGYFEAIVPILQKHDILLIADEVVTAFGRLGKWFGSEFYGFRPDSISVAKGLTSAYLPMSACIVSEKIWSVIYEKGNVHGVFGHGYTYSAHPVTAAAALCNLDIIEREGLVDRAATEGAWLQGELRARFKNHPLVGEVRGEGMIAAIELVADKTKKAAFDLKVNTARRALNYAMEDGLIVRAVGNILAFSPPLVTSREDLQTIVDKLERAVNRLAEDLKSKGEWAG